MRLALTAAAVPAGSDDQRTARSDNVGRPTSGDGHRRPQAPGHTPDQPTTLRPSPTATPVRLVSSESIAHANPSVQPANGGAKKAETSKVVTILDDDDAIGAFTIGILERAGYRVVIFRNCDAFLAAQPSGETGCVLLDMRTPGVEGLEVLRMLRARESMPPVVMLSAEGDIHGAVEAMKLGAADFLAKPCPPASLLEAIDHAVDAGPTKTTAAVDRDAVAKIASLSQRQMQVLQGILEGKLNKIIAYEHSISTRTVEAYRAQLLKKLGVRGTAETVRLAMAAGLL